MLAFMLTVISCGCGTIGNNDRYEGPARPYGGVMTDFVMGTGREIGCGPWWFLDMPFSLIGDTLSLPFNAHWNHQIRQFEQSKTNEPGSNPLSGWKSSSIPGGIYDDYMDYINKLPTKERYAAQPIQFLEDGTGRHAVRIYIPLSGAWWEHVIIYGQNNRRLSANKRISGRFRS